MNSLYLFILPIGFGIMTLVLGLICVVGYITSNEPATKNKLRFWFLWLLPLAFLLLTVGIMTTGQFFA